MHVFWFSQFYFLLLLIIFFLLLTHIILDLFDYMHTWAFQFILKIFYEQKCIEKTCMYNFFAREKTFSSRRSAGYIASTLLLLLLLLLLQ
jgi:hypothetical protein